MLAWAEALGHIVWPGEYAILRAMDLALCEARNEEYSAYRERTAPPIKGKGGKP